MPSNKVAPIIDFSPFLSGEPAKVQQCAEEIRSACQKEGFFQIINHPITLELQQKTFEQQKKLFSLPLEEKLKLDKAQNDYNRGYEVIGAQQFEVGTTELKEGFYVARDLPLDDPAVLNKKFGYGPNLWPEALGPEFRQTCMAYLDQITDLAEKVMQALAIALEIPQHYVDDFCKNPMGASVPSRVTHRAPVDRYSIAFNYNGNPDFEIKCIDSCRREGKEEKYAPIAVEDAIREKYKEVYKAAGIYKVAEPAKAHQGNCQRKQERPCDAGESHIDDKSS
ncbi:MAG: hypothetical protein Q9181_001881 [Wetmoreana brouardii]